MKFRVFVEGSDNDLIPFDIPSIPTPIKEKLYHARAEIMVEDWTVELETLEQLTKLCYFFEGGVCIEMGIHEDTKGFFIEDLRLMRS